MSDDQAGEGKLAEVVAAVLIPLGSLAVIIGVAKVYPPLAWIVGGAFAVVIGWRLAR